MAQVRLTLPEEYALLALDDESGKIPFSLSETALHGLAGALLLELALRGRLRLSGRRVDVVEGPPARDPLLNEVLHELRWARKSRTVRQWVEKLARRRSWRRVVGGLARARILDERSHRVLGLFPARRYPTRTPQVEDEVRGRLRRVAVEGAAPDARTACLLVLVHATGLATRVFSRPERRRARERARALAQHSEWAGRVAKAIDDVKVANVYALVAATTTVF